MKIGPKYKKARRLGAPLFEKTQTDKYKLRSSRKFKQYSRSKTNFGVQMLEKQKARFFYGVNERQFNNYVKKALEYSTDSTSFLVSLLEARLDNAVLRSGFAPTRSAARQMVSHGHIKVNGKIVNIPSYHLRIGDVFTIREGSKTKNLFKDIWEKVKKNNTPNWLKVDIEKETVSISGEPKMKQEDLLFNVKSVLEFYTR